MDEEGKQGNSSSLFWDFMVEEEAEWESEETVWETESDVSVSKCVSVSDVRETLT